MSSFPNCGIYKAAKEVAFVVQIGQWNILPVLRNSDRGLYLDGGSDGPILLPQKETPEIPGIGESLKVFVYLDSEDRLIATREHPYAQVGEFAFLRVKSLERIGAFLDWGLLKDLFIPYAEQTRDLKVGQYIPVALYLDKSGRISASMRVDRFLSKEPVSYQDGQEVALFIVGTTDLGYRAIINNAHLGLLYHNEVFTSLEIGNKIKGYIKTVRADGKIDLMLSKTGHQGADDVADKILEKLKSQNGFLALTDKTDPETIYKLFGVSKKKYKIALGGLYKKRLIKIEEDGIRLV